VITVLNSCNALLQTESAPALRGRVMAIYMTIVMGGTPLGSPVIGWIGEQYGARWTLVVGGALVLVGVGLAVVVRRAAVARLEPTTGSTPVVAPAMMRP
jgi:MFS family permease